MSEDARYAISTQEKQKQHEAICVMCGDCCGLQDGDPCSNLMKINDNMYICKDYENRLKLQHTVSGNSFNCVEIREVLQYEDTLLNCAYRRKQIGAN